ncbi:MAG: phosphoribosylamine--glycine ligase [Actinomycetaceae bacterium]|nr:phosphoribosylamine--glycine ligase [Actinomycetaceae bacterium]
MKVLVIGSGGREMSLVAHLAQRHQVYCAGRSDAIAQIATMLDVPDLPAPQCWEELADVALAEGIELTIVGPEGPLSSGVVDVFTERGLRIFGPTAAAAQIESSKSFAKDVMEAAGVPTAAYRYFTDPSAVAAYLDTDIAYPVVLKEDGLRAGKGVTICATREDAHETLSGLVVDDANPLLVEEFLEGFEFSLIVLANGTEVIALPVAQDHKPIGEGNTGPNTGGMGAVTPVPRVTPELVEETMTRVIGPTLAEMVARGNTFTGFLYAGLIATAGGVKVIEFNARLGDPEAEVLLPRLEGDLGAAASALLDGTDYQLEISPDTVVGTVLSSPGYPGTVTASPDIPQALFDAIAGDQNAGIIHMGTQRYTDEQGNKKWRANGGRVAIVTMRGDSIASCQQKIIGLLADTLGESELYYRRDIGAFAG